MSEPPVDETLEEEPRKRAKTDRPKTEPNDVRAATDRADDVAEMRRELEELKQVLRDTLPKQRKKRKS
jgi:hypothetical protein